MSKTIPTTAKTSSKINGSNPRSRASAKTRTKGSRAAMPHAKVSSAADTPAKSKCDQILQLLRRNKGASLAELQEATGWQAHSVRGFLSGTVKKRMGLSLSSDKPEHGERRYIIAGA